VFRHSGARNGWVTLKHQNSQLVITIRDDGKGIGESVAEFQYGSIGVGIRGMRQRAKEFGGVLRLENTNSGTRVMVTMQRGVDVVPVISSEGWMVCVLGNFPHTRFLVHTCLQQTPPAEATL
jgi:signal transduction histidine kinase